MSKNEEKSQTKDLAKGGELTAEKLSSNMDVLQISEDTFLTPEQMDLLLANENFIEDKISAEYLKGDSLAVGEQLKFVVKGFKEIKGIGDKLVKAVILYGSDRKQYINASAKLVGECSTAGINSTIAATYKGKKKAKNGNYDDFDISVLHHFKK